MKWRKGAGITGRKAHGNIVCTNRACMEYKANDLMEREMRERGST